MATKRIQIAFELTTEKEWQDFIRQPGLIVVDLFRDWAGPCVAMNTPLKNLKTSDTAYEWMHLATAPSSIVPELKRLEGSMPTFVLLSGKRLVNVIFGCNAPRVIRIIKEEIEREKRAAHGLEKRQTLSLTKLTPAELEMQELRLGSDGARLREEQAQAQMESDQRLRRVLDQIADNLPNTTVVVVFPYARQSDACEDILGALRGSWAELGFAVKREEEMELGREAVDLMFWERRLPQHDVLMDSVMQGLSLVLMLERDDAEEEVEVERDEDEEDEEEDDAFILDVEHVIAKSIYGFLPGTGSSMELITPLDSVGSADGVGVDGGQEEQQEQAEQADGGEDEGENEGEQGEGEDAEEDEDEGDTPREDDAEDEAEDAEDEGGKAQSDGDEEGEDESGEKAASPAEQSAVQDPQDEEEVDLLDERDDDVISQAPVRVWNPRELLPALDSAAARLLFRHDDKGPVLPGIWTPLTAVSKAAAIKALFEELADTLYEPPTPPPPPKAETTVLCFAGDKREEVLQVSAGFPDQVSQFGFFTKSRKLLAETRADYEKLVQTGLQVLKTLVVLEVTRVPSKPLLELATAGPLYVSATPAIARADVDEFFGSRVVHATQDDLRDIVRVHSDLDAEVEEEAAAAPAKPQASAVAEVQGEGVEAAAVEPHQDAGAEQVAENPVEQGVGDGEAVPEGAEVHEDAVEPIAEAADVAAEEQLLNEGGEGDAPVSEGRPSLVGGEAGE